MIQALSNRIRMLKLDLSFIDKLKLLFFSILSPIFAKFNKIIKKFNISYNSNIIYINNSTDLGTFLEVFLHEEYRFEYIKSVKRILDLGANVGFTSIYLADKYNDAQVIAVEADQDNVIAIQENIKSCDNCIIIEPVAISSKKGEISFYKNFSTSISGSTVKRDEKAIKVTVPTLTLSDLENKYGAFDIIKFDIEGGEWDAVKPEMLKIKPKLWIGEYHEDIIGFSVDEFTKRFTGYAVSVIKIAKKRYLIQCVSST